MLVKFVSSETGELMMFAEMASTLLRAVGKETGRRGTFTREEMLQFLDGKVAKWWLPEDVVFVDDLPHTATGKLQKTKLRELFRDYRFPEN